MQTYVRLTRLSPDAMKSPAALIEVEQEAMSAIKSSCHGVEWLQSYAVLGGCDYLDKISMHSEKGKGSTVRFTIRLHKTVGAPRGAPPGHD